MCAKSDSGLHRRKNIPSRTVVQFVVTLYLRHPVEQQEAPVYTRQTLQLDRYWWAWLLAWIVVPFDAHKSLRSIRMTKLPRKRFGLVPVVEQALFTHSSRNCRNCTTASHVGIGITQGNKSAPLPIHILLVTHHSMDVVCPSGRIWLPYSLVIAPLLVEKPHPFCSLTTPSLIFHSM